MIFFFFLLQTFTKNQHKNLQSPVNNIYIIYYIYVLYMYISHAYIYTYIYTYYIYIYIDIYVDRQIDRQKGRQIDIDIYRYRQI